MKNDNTFLNAFLEMVFPHRCIVCDDVIMNEGFCNLHKDAIVPNTKETCFGCGSLKKQCECKRFVYHFDGLVSPYIDDELARDAVYKLKFRDGFDCVNVFGDEMAKCVKKSFGIENIDMICFVPSTKKRYLWRGFNQSEFFAKRISLNLDIPVRDDILFKKDSVKTQHEISTVRERFLNVRDGYYTKRIIKNKNVLLVDDIKTSGASLDECARQLKFAGAAKVYAVTAILSTKNRKSESKE
jgi:competence protein ComFC